MKLAVPDLISPSYFPAAAAVELGSPDESPSGRTFLRSLL